MNRRILPCLAIAGILGIGHVVDGNAVERVASIPGTFGGAVYAGDGFLYSYAQNEFYRINPATQQVETESTPFGVYRTVSKGTENSVVTSAGQIVFGIGIDNSCPRITSQNIDGQLVITDEDWGAIVKHTPWEEDGARWQVFGFDSPNQPRICPTGAMAIDVNDNLYFISKAPDKDEIYRLSADWTELTLLKEFELSDTETTTAEGRSPTGVFISNDGGTLYVVNELGGNNPFEFAPDMIFNNYGTIARIDLTNPEPNYEVIRHAGIVEDGQIFAFRGSAPLVEAGNKLYYSSHSGSALYGNGDQGSISSIDLNAGDAQEIHESRQTVVAFNLTAAPEGGNPLRLLIGEEGDIYGITQSSGSNNLGTLFKVSAADNAFETLHVFGDNLDVNERPDTLALGWNGTIYGTTLSEPILFKHPASDDTKVRILSFYPQNPQLVWTAGSLQTELHWFSENAESCTASGEWSGSKALSSEEAGETITIAQNGINQFTLSCSNGDDTVSRTLTVSASELPPPANITDFRSDIYALTAGDSFTLNWTTEDAASCVITQNGNTVHSIATADTVSGSHQITAPSAGERSYGLTCTGLGGDSVEWESPLLITVEAPPPEPISSSGGGALSPALLLLLMLTGLVRYAARKPRRQRA